MNTHARLTRCPRNPRRVYNVGETDDRTWLTGGYHDGVMGLYFMTGEKCKTAGCVAEDDTPAIAA